MNEKYHYYTPKEKDEDLNSSLRYMYLLASSYGFHDLEFEVVVHEKLGKVIRADEISFGKWREVLTLVKWNNQPEQESTVIPAAAVAEQSSAPEAIVVEQSIPVPNTVVEEDTEIVVDTNEFLSPDLDKALASGMKNEASEIGSSVSSDGNGATIKQPRKRSRYDEVRVLQSEALSAIGDSLFASSKKSHNTRNRFVAVDNEVEVASHLYHKI